MLNIERKSSTRTARLPVSPDRAERFLERLANLDTANEKKLWTFADRFSDFLPHEGPESLLHVPDDFAVRFKVRSQFLRQIQARLRTIWREQAPLLKEANIMLLAGEYMRAYATELEDNRRITADLPKEILAIMGLEPPRPDAFVMVLLHALKHVQLLRYCANPGCQEPYFVARRHSQVFCSEPCAVVSQRASKLKWWREHGAARRKATRKGKPRRQRGNKK